MDYSPDIRFHYNEENILEELRKYIIMYSNVPIGSKVIPECELEKYKGKLLAGWLLDGQYKVYGFLKGKLSFHGYSLGCVWEIPENEIKELTTYEV